MRVPRIPVSRLVLLAALALACNDPSGPAPLGNIQIVIVPSGADIVTTGLQVRVVSFPVQQLDSGRLTVTYPGMEPGTYNVQLEGLSSNCQVTSTNPRQITVAANQTTVVTFTMTCTRRVGALRVVTATTGTDADPDGYVMVIDGVSYPLPVNGVATVPGIGEGFRSVTLGGVVPNCEVADGATRTVFVTVGGTTDVVFNIGCVTFGSVEVTVATTGVDLDSDGFSANLQAASVGFSQDVNVGPNGSIVFDRLRPADDYHLTLNGVSANCTASGGPIRAFTVEPGETAHATFAVSCELGRLLAFVRSDDIYTMASNGTGLTRVTTNVAWDADPAWSSTGRIAFTTTRDNDAELYVMNADGSNATRLTTSAGTDRAPSWSPDGQKIAFESYRDVNREIYVVNADGTGLTRLTNNVADDTDPAWSSTGKIAFVSTRDHDAGEIYVMNADGSNVVRLTTNDSTEATPAWSPDGSMIAFARVVECYYTCAYDLFVMNADGTGTRRLATGWQTYQFNTNPAWSPNGHTISFTRQYCSYYYYCDVPEVWVVDVQGTQLQQLVTNAADAAWKP